MLAQPCAACDPDAMVRGVDGRGAAPHVRVVMEYPSAASVMFLRRPYACFRDVGDHIEQRLMAFGQVRRFRRPVVHFDVDVDRVFAAPGRVFALVPDALQVERLRPRARPADHEITPELKISRRQFRIVVVGKRLDANVRRPLRVVRVAEVELNAVEEPLIILNMLFFGGVVVGLKSEGGAFGAQLGGVGVGGFVVARRGGARQNERRRFRLLNMRMGGAVRNADASAFCQNVKPRLKPRDPRSPPCRA